MCPLIMSDFNTFLRLLLSESIKLKAGECVLPHEIMLLLLLLFISLCRYVYNVGCRERKDISVVRGASRYIATLIGGGGGDGRVSNMALGWIGYDGKASKYMECRK